MTIIIATVSLTRWACRTASPVGHTDLSTATPVTLDASFVTLEKRSTRHVMIQKTSVYLEMFVRQLLVNSTNDITFVKTPTRVIDTSKCITTVYVHTLYVLEPHVLGEQIWGESCLSVHTVN